ncbi:putative urease/membrane protein [Novosphingobium sp. Rr 2-17]|uniref:HupE/UreJ family protein n=1 Tax=Novosphingobium sp. Rr 2-17 TaxID=555793 RepID=UPI000269A54A|nr:HupE/UreJ family protein [Novosphingobium sp. Rr 2-17]EIZ77872.1 putative urease/membrane protein [Novosphingobium sp. Rr 2-17]
MKRIATTALTLAAALAPAAALAHPGHGDDSFAAGVIHPLTGADHIAAMLLVGLGAAIFLKRDGWMLPVAFLAALALGFSTFALIPSTLAEAGIIASVIALGVATAFQAKAPAPIALLLVALFGYAHGAAHGIEAPQGTTPALFAGGFLAASAALHLGGYVLARTLPVSALRLIGVGSAGFGLALAALT